MKNTTGAAILAGGQSKRMGKNKALLRFAESGPTIIEMVVKGLAEAGFATPLLVTNRPRDYDFLGLRTVADDVKDAGALGGILTALNHSRQNRLFVVACDMPLLSVNMLHFMLAVRGNYDALVPHWHDGERVRVEPLHAIYSTSCADVIKNRIGEGQLKVSSFLEIVNTRYLDEEELRPHDPSLKSFLNVNSPEDWEAIKSAATYL